MSKKIRINSFFSGIGGFDLGFQKVGFEVKYQCEIDSLCNCILKDKWPNVQRSLDITKVETKDIPEAEVWCGGFPCQDVSVARGSMIREGLKGKNSGLFFKFLDLIKAKSPKVVLIENVTGLLNSHDGNDFRVVIQSLTGLGYGVSWRVFNSRYFGTPQSRPRVYICAWKNSLEKATFTLHEFQNSIKPSNQRQGFMLGKHNSKLGISVPEVAYCLAATSGRHTGTDWSRTYISYFDRVRRLTPSEAEKLQGFPPGWSIPVDLKVDKHLDIDTARYHAIGNAVSVPVIVWIADRVKKMLEKQIVNRGLQPVLKKFADFSQGPIRTQFFSQLTSATLFDTNVSPKIKWYSGGMGLADEVIDCKVGNCPTCPYESSLIDLIDDKEPEAKYFISPSAAIGIIRRVNSQNRKLFPPLMKALVRLSNLKKSMVANNSTF